MLAPSSRCLANRQWKIFSRPPPPGISTSCDHEHPPPPPPLPPGNFTYTTQVWQNSPCHDRLLALAQLDPECWVAHVGWRCSGWEILLVCMVIGGPCRRTYQLCT